MKNGKMTIADITNSFDKYANDLEQEYVYREEARKRFNRRWSEMKEEGEMANQTFSELLIEKLADVLNVASIQNYGGSLVEIYIDEKKSSFISGYGHAKVSFHMKKYLGNTDHECTWMVRNEDTIDAVESTMGEHDTIDDVFESIMKAVDYQSKKYPKIQWKK